MENKIEKLIDSIYESYNSNIEKLTEVLVSINPESSDYAAVVTEVLKKHLSFDKLKPGLIEIYNKYIAPEHIDQITNFYLSDAGKNFLLHQTEIYTETQLLSKSILAENNASIEHEIDEWIKNESNKQNNNI